MIGTRPVAGQQAMGGEGAVGSDGCVYIIRRAAGVGAAVRPDAGP